MTTKDVSWSRVLTHMAVTMIHIGAATETDWTTTKLRFKRLFRENRILGATKVTPAVALRVWAAWKNWSSTACAMTWARSCRHIYVRLKRSPKTEFELATTSRAHPDGTTRIIRPALNHAALGLRRGKLTAFMRWRAAAKTRWLCQTACGEYQRDS